MNIGSMMRFTSASGAALMLAVATVHAQDAALPPPILSLARTVSTPSTPVTSDPRGDYLYSRDHAILTLDAIPVAVEGSPSSASAASSSEAELAKKLSNPVADLISVPFQYNADFGIGSNNASRSTLNIQPVIPISLTPEWNLITRTIVPVIYADSPAPGASTNWGLGDTTQSFFLSPVKETNGWIWGVGPVFLWPTATDVALGTGKWGAGPTVVLLQQREGWTYGMLANHIWSYAGDGDRSSVNATFIQPFIAYQFPTHTTLTLNTESTFDWTNDQWTVPVNLMVSQVLKVGNQPISLQLGGRCYADGPSGGPEWGLRFALILLFPRQ